MRVEPLTIVVIMVGLLLILGNSCAMTQTQKQALTSVAASTSGYAIGKERPEIIDPFLKWSDKVLVFLDSEAPTDGGLEFWMQIGFNLLVGDEFLQFQFGNFLKIFDFKLGTEIGVPQVLTEEYKALVKEALVGLKMGLIQAKI